MSGKAFSKICRCDSKQKKWEVTVEAEWERTDQEWGAGGWTSSCMSREVGLWHSGSFNGWWTACSSRSAEHPSYQNCQEQRGLSTTVKEALNPLYLVCWSSQDKAEEIGEMKDCGQVMGRASTAHDLCWNEMHVWEVKAPEKLLPLCKNALRVSFNT